MMGQPGEGAGRQGVPRAPAARRSQKPQLFPTELNTPGGWWGFKEGSAQEAGRCTFQLLVSYLLDVGCGNSFISCVASRRRAHFVAARR
jgi:hypothetical protein